MDDDIDNILAISIANAALGFLEEDEEEEDEILSLISDEFVTDAIDSSVHKGRTKHYVDYIVPLYSDQDFKHHYRMTRPTFQALYNEIGHTFQKRMGRPTIDPKKMMLAAIWMLATPNTIKSIGERFDLSKSSVVDVMKRVCMALIETLSDTIRIPTIEEMKEIEEGFRMQTGFPGVIGAVDGTQIPIKTPSIAPEIYVNNRGTHSIHLQAVCDHKMIFWDCFCGYPGSVHDAEIFQNSEVNEFFHSGQVPADFHILGDAGYPLMEHVLVPYTDNGHLSKCQVNYNDKVKETKSVVNNAFASLKNRFQRLKYIEIERTDKVPMYVLAGCILHNFCLRRKDYFLCTDQDEDFLTPDILDETNEESAYIKRDQIADLLSP